MYTFYITEIVPVVYVAFHGAKVYTAYAWGSNAICAHAT